MWVIAVLAGLAGLLTLALCVPFDAVLNLDSSVRPKFRLRLVWLFGLFSKEVKKGEKKPEEEKKVAKEKPKKKRRTDFGTILRILRSKGLLKQFKDLVKDILSQFKIRELAVNCKLGLDNPADTGLLFAVIGPATLFLNFPSQYQLRVQPSFHDEAIFEGYLHGVLRLQPIRLVWPLIKFVFSLAVLRAVKTLVLSKWKRKK